MRWLVLALLVSACSPGGALSLLTGGGPNIAANTQIGKENNQGINIKTTTESASRPENVIEAPVETINQNVVQNTDVDRTLILALVLIGLLGWLLPTPSAMGKAIAYAVTAPFKRKNN